MKSILIWDDNDVHLYPIDCYVWHIAGLSAAAGEGLLPESLFPDWDWDYCRNLIAGLGLVLLPESYCRIGARFIAGLPLSPFVTGRRMYPVGLDIGRRPCYNDFAE
jgi:hypothetical protein